MNRKLMKSGFLTIVLVSTAMLETSCMTIAGGQAAKGRPSHDEAVAQMKGIMYLHEMSIKCPFPKNINDTLEMMVMVVAPTLTSISHEETIAIAKQTDARVDSEIATSKEESCKQAEQKLRTFM